MQNNTPFSCKCCLPGTAVPWSSRAEGGSAGAPRVQKASGSPSRVSSCACLAPGGPTFGVFFQTLLELGASPDYKDSYGLTPLYHTAVVGGDPCCCELLLHEHAAVSCKDENGWHEIHQVRGARPSPAIPMGRARAVAPDAHRPRYTDRAWDQVLPAHRGPSAGPSPPGQGAGFSGAPCSGVGRVLAAVG